jgi:hypothetical protein
MEIKIISDDYFVDLIQLYIQSYAVVPIKRTAVEATKILVDDILYKQDFCAFGLFKEQKLMGFLSGFGVTETTYHFSNLYTIMGFNRRLKELFDFSELAIKKLGYTNWESDCVTDNMCSVHKSYGAKQVYTRYQKVIL